MDWTDAEKWADEVEVICANMRQGYINMGMQCPPTERLILMALCAWSARRLDRHVLMGM